MIKVEKSPLPFGVIIKSDNDYRTNPVLDIMKNDFFNKCYICETKSPIRINVEHRVSHQGNLLLKYDWNNLFFSCGHCNSAKSIKFDDVIDCTKYDPENYIGLSMKPFPKEQVCIDNVKNDNFINSTIELLEKVYNGIDTDMLSAECENLRNSILKDLITFQANLINYFEDYDRDMKIAYKGLIKKELYRGASYAAFKRKIVRDNINLYKEFGEFIN